MSWISGNCQNDRHYSCTYANPNNFDSQWCVDSDEPCPRINDGGYLLNQTDNTHSGGW